MDENTLQQKTTLTGKHYQTTEVSENFTSSTVEPKIKSKRMAVIIREGSLEMKVFDDRELQQPQSMEAVQVNLEALILVASKRTMERSVGAKQICFARRLVFHVACLW